MIFQEVQCLRWMEKEKIGTEMYCEIIKIVRVYCEIIKIVQVRGSGGLNQSISKGTLKGSQKQRAFHFQNEQQVRGRESERDLDDCEPLTDRWAVVP